MKLFKSKAEKELDAIIQRLNMNMSNNYKDNAQDNLRELEAEYETAKSENRLKGEVLSEYGRILDEYKEKLQGYTHKDQKPYWY
jgi:hypothetical protein